MNQQRYQHGLTTGQCLWLVITVALGLALGSQAAARECRQETPLPADVRLIAPGPQVPEAVARFGPRDVERLLADAAIVRHRGKIEAAIANARATLALREAGTPLPDVSSAHVLRGNMLAATRILCPDPAVATAPAA